MGSLSIWHWTIIFFILVLGIPIARKLTRAKEKLVHGAQSKLKWQP